MKILILLAFALIASSLAKNTLKNKNRKSFSKHTNKQIPLLPSQHSYNIDNANFAAPPIQVLPAEHHYANAPTDPYALQRAAQFKNAEIFDGTLPTRLSPYPYTGEYREADDIGGKSKLFYNGADNLSRHVQINCAIITGPLPCTANQHCGWCTQSNSCVTGTPLGPTGSCLRKAFYYNAPSKEWDPLTAPSKNYYAERRGIPVFQVVPE